MRVVLILAASVAVVSGALAGKSSGPGRDSSDGDGLRAVWSRSGCRKHLDRRLRGGKLLKIDDRDGRKQATVAVGRWACRVAVGPAAVWVTRDRAGELVRVSRGTGRLRRLKVGAGAFDVLLARGSVWTTSYEAGAIVRMDASTMRLQRLYKHGPNPAGLASCGGRIWVGHGREVTWLTSIDPSTHRMRRVPVDRAAPGWPECIRGMVWVTTPDSIVRIDPRSGRVRPRLHIGETLAHAAEGPDGLVWVTDKQHSVVLRVTPNGKSVDSFPAGPDAFALARAGDAMWVTSFAGSDIRRYDP